MKEAKKKLSAAMIAAAVSAGLTACGGRSSSEKDQSTPDREMPVKYAVRAIQDDSGDTLKMCYADFQIENRYNKYGEDYYDRVAAGYHDDFTEEYGDGFRLRYKIEKSEQLGSKDCKEYEQRFNEEYGKEVSITDGYYYQAVLTVKNGDSKEEIKTEYNVFEIDGEWVLFGEELDG